MNINPNVQQRLLLLAALAAPVIIVQVMRGVLGAGAMPASSRAAQVSAEPAPPEAAPATTPADAKAQAKLAAWLETQSPSPERLASLRSPMDYVPAPTTVQPASPATPTAAPTPNGPRHPMVLGTILHTSRGAIAAINGQVLRVGEEVEPGWTLIAIDVESRTATVQGPKGQTLLLSR